MFVCNTTPQARHGRSLAGSCIPFCIVLPLSYTVSVPLHIVCIKVVYYQLFGIVSRLWKFLACVEVGLVMYTVYW